MQMKPIGHHADKASLKLYNDSIKVKGGWLEGVGEGLGCFKREKSTTVWCWARTEDLQHTCNFRDTFSQYGEFCDFFREKHVLDVVQAFLRIFTAVSTSNQFSNQGGTEVQTLTF